MFHSVSLLSQAPLACGSRALPIVLFNCVPTFSRDLGTFTSEDIEMRVCRDEGSEDEDIILDNVEIYVH